MGRIEERAIKILRNVPKRLVANLRHQSEVNSDTLLNSAVKCLNILSRSSNVSNKILLEAWGIYGRLQRLSGKVATKFMDNDHNKPLRVESASIRPHVQGQNWDQFYNAGGKPFDQYYRHGGNWRYGTRIWKSRTMTSKNTKV